MFLGKVVEANEHVHNDNLNRDDEESSKLFDLCDDSIRK